MEYIFCLPIKWPENMAVRVHRIIARYLIGCGDFFSIKFLDFRSNSLSVVPHINEIYPGIKGSTQGDKKLIKPAKKTIK